MALEGVVTNVTAFGAFVDIGVHQDGLVHISQLSDKFVRDPNEVVKVGDKLKVKVLEVDLVRKRISLTAKSGEGPTQGAFGKKPQPQEGNTMQRKPRQQENNQSTATQQNTKFSNNPFERLLRK